MHYPLTHPSCCSINRLSRITGTLREIGRITHSGLQIVGRVFLVRQLFVVGYIMLYEYSMT